MRFRHGEVPERQQGSNMYGDLPYTVRAKENKDMAPPAVMERESKKERLEARLTPEQKKHIEQDAFNFRSLEESLQRH